MDTMTLTFGEETFHVNHFLDGRIAMAFFPHEVTAQRRSSSHSFWHFMAHIKVTTDDM